jgi:hypothetical protein
MLGCIEAPPSLSRLTAAFAPQLLRPTCRALSASPPPRGSRFARTWPPPNSPRAVRSNAGFRPLPSSRRPLMPITRDPPAHQLGRGLSSPSGNTVMRCTPPLCTSLPCIALPPSSVVGHALASALPRRRSLRGRPCQGTAVCSLAALRAGLPRAATLQLHPRISALPAPRAATPPRACATHSSAYHARQARAPTLLLRPPSVRTLLLPLQPSHCFRCAAPSFRACSLLPSEPAPHGLTRPRREPLARLPARPPLHLRALARATAAPSPAPCARVSLEPLCIVGAPHVLAQLHARHQRHARAAPAPFTAVRQLGPPCPACCRSPPTPLPN